MAYRNEPHFAAHCEIQDAAAGVSDDLVTNSPSAATVEFAKLLTRFDGQIEDEWRETIIHIAGALFKLHDRLNGGENG